MIAGFFTAWPVNRLLVRHGVKEKMDHRRHLATMVAQLGEAGEASDEPTARERGQLARDTTTGGAAAVADGRRRGSVRD